MTKYATALPFPAPADHQFVELRAPHPHHPSHFVAKAGRYFKNYEGKVYVPEEHVEEILADGCTLFEGSDFSLAPAEPLAYQPALFEAAG